MSPTERTKAKLKAEGWPLVAVVEHWNPFAHVRQDLFGFVDVLAVRDNEILAVQCTTGDHVADRVKKIKSNSASLVWLASSSRRLVVWGFSKTGLRGKRKRWECREVEILL